MKNSDKSESCCASCSCTRGPGLWLLLIAAAIVVGVTLWPRQREGISNAEANSATVTNSSSAKAETNGDLQFLKGRWLRPDGGYVLEIRKVDADGQLDASYFNPNPIRVVSAKATKDGAAVKIYIELNDVNYPGCKYNLTYIPEQRQMVGTYFQAALQQTYEVAFEREQ